MELMASVLAGVLSAAAWEAVKWACASVRARKKPATESNDERA